MSCGCSLCRETVGDKIVLNAEIVLDNREGLTKTQQGVRQEGIRGQDKALNIFKQIEAMDQFSFSPAIRTF